MQVPSVSVAAPKPQLVDQGQEVSALAWCGVGCSAGSSTEYSAEHEVSFCRLLASESYCVLFVPSLWLAPSIRLRHDVFAAHDNSCFVKPVGVQL